MFEESIKPPSRSDNNFNPQIIYNHGGGWIKLKGSV